MKLLSNLLKPLQKKLPGVTAIDGKTARKSADKSQGKSPLHFVSAWSSANSPVLAQVAVDKKSNEITAIPKLLDMPDLEREVVTIDAIGCQRAIADKILGKSGDYILSLKGNQGTLYDDIRVLTEIPEFDPPYDLPDREICQLLPWTEDGFLPMEGENQIAEDVGPDPPFFDDNSDSSHCNDHVNPPHWEN
ncbi:MAG: ISAs1 family transposase [Waddliaceae bacterium]